MGYRWLETLVLKRGWPAILIALTLSTGGVLLLYCGSRHHPTRAFALDDNEGDEAPEGKAKADAGTKAKAPGEAKPPEAPPPQDQIVLVEGKTLSGTLLDLAGDEYVFNTQEAKLFLPRSSVKSLTRFLSEKRIASWTKNVNDFKELDKLQRFAAFLREKRAYPEERLCWRRILQLKPDDEQAKRALGQLPLAGQWLTEKDAHAKLADGHKEEGGQLVKMEPITVVKKDPGATDDKPSTTETKSASEKKSATKKVEVRNIKAVDHLARVLDDKDEHSLWMLMKRSGVQALAHDRELVRVNIKTCKQVIASLSAPGKDYKKEMSSLLKRYDVPRDWAAFNAKLVEEFKSKNSAGIHLETKHYHILSTASKEMTHQLGHHMDIVVDQVYHKIFEFEEKIANKYILRLWKNRVEFTRNGGSPQAAAYFKPTTKELVGYDLKTSGAGPEETFHTLYHEGWHQYFDFYIPDAPRWYDEGFAEVIYPTVIKGNKAIRKGFNASRSSEVTQAAARKNLLPLRDLIKMTHEEMYDPVHVHLAYAQSWSFIYFLTNYTNSDRKLQERVRNFYKDYFWELHKGTDFIEAVDIVFKDVKFDTLEQAWIKAIPYQK